MDTFTDKLAPYLEEALPETEVAELERHLADCPDCQAEYTALKHVDQLFMVAPMIAPPIDFAARFEARLDRRMNRRRTWLGVAVISLILVMSAGLLVWSVTNSGPMMLDWVGGIVTFISMLGVAQAAIVVGETVFKVATLVTNAMIQATGYAAFWGVVVLAVGVISLWAQLLRWIKAAQQPVTV